VCGCQGIDVVDKVFRGLAGCCCEVAKVFWVNAREFTCVKLLCTILGSCVWLPGCCYPISKVFWVVAK